MSTLNRVVIHHTANPNDFNTTSESQSRANVRAIQNYHMDVNGWSDIGYHFLVDKLGNRFEGRYGSLTSYPKGAHDSVNSNSFGINIMGYFHSPYNQTPPSAQRNAMYDLIAWRVPNGFNAYGGSTYGGRSNVGYVCGHRDVKSTACPGDKAWQYIGSNLSGGEARTAIANRIAGGSTPTTIIVDNVAPNFTASSNWWTGSSTAGYYGSNYHVRSTASVSDTAAWKGNIPTTGTYEVYVRYSAGSNRASAAPYIVYHSGGATTVYVNQQINGGKWVSLGKYNFAQGSTATRVRLSCWTNSGTYVIADAVQFVRR